jgi:hypothetical protein
MDRPNILLLVWDSARVDYVRKYADFFQSLAEENLSFSRAVAPGTWSLPSHVSLFSGTYPHEHGCIRINDDYVNTLPLLDELREDEYQCIGVSGNGFASPAKNFDLHFDEFYYTPSNIPFDDGLAVEAMGNHLQNEGYEKTDIAPILLRRSLAHNHRVKSLGNLTKLTCWYLAKQYNMLSRLPISLFNAEQEYNPEENTERIIDVLDRYEGVEEPFFLFANYMDCHWPYDPPAEISGRHTDAERSVIDRINEDVAKPWDFVNHVEGDKQLDEGDVETIRNLYAGEVESVDVHLQRIFEALEERGLREETLVVITADHGEALGEADGRGWRRMGHEGSISDHLLRVPLIIAHPALNSEMVNDWVSLKSLRRLFTEGRDRLLNSAGRDYEALLPDQGIVLSEYPAVGGESLYEKYSAISRESLADRVDVHTVTAYYDDWKVAVDSTGREWAWQDGAREETAAAPKVAVDACKEAVSDLRRYDGGGSAISEGKKERLEALGYL